MSRFPIVLTPLLFKLDHLFGTIKETILVWKFLECSLQNITFSFNNNSFNKNLEFVKKLP